MSHLVKDLKTRVNNDCTVPRCSNRAPFGNVNAYQIQIFLVESGEKSSLGFAPSFSALSAAAQWISTLSLGLL